MKESGGTEGILIVSSSEKSGRMIAGLIEPPMSSSIVFEKTGNGTRRVIQSRRFCLTIINAPLSDEYGHELAVDLARHTTSGVILIVKGDVYGEVCEQVNGEGVLTVTKPLSATQFFQLVRAGMAQSARLSSQAEEMERLKEKLAESRLVGRAKCILVETRGINEAEAHRIIEKRAMDTRVPRRTVAEDIIRMYDS